MHQRDEYAYISNFLFSSVLSDKNYDGSESVALPFTDVAEGAYYADAVAWAIQNKVTSGVSATTFAPNASCTRGQMVTFLWKAAGSPEPKSQTTAFTDVKSGAYYEKAVAWAVENKVTTGTSATTFTVFRCNSGAWRITKEFTTESECIAWCDTKLGKVGG